MDLSTSSIEDKKLANDIRFKFKQEGENIEAGKVVFDMKVKHNEETKEEVEEEKSGSIDAVAYTSDIPRSLAVVAVSTFSDHGEHPGGVDVHSKALEGEPEIDINGFQIYRGHDIQTRLSAEYLELHAANYVTPTNDYYCSTNPVKLRRRGAIRRIVNRRTQDFIMNGPGLHDPATGRVIR